MTLTSFEIAAYLFALFLTIYGLVFLFFSRFKIGNKEEPGIESFVKTRIFLFVMALLYFAFAHFTVLAALTYNVDVGYRAPCENVLLRTEYHYINETGGARPTDSSLELNYTVNFYNDTCSNYVVPGGQTGILDAYSWLLYLDMALLFLGMMFVFLAAVIKKW